MEVQRADGKVLSLPDNILFQIFVKLRMKDLCQCALVCKTWKNLSHDPVLWRFIDFTPFHLSIEDVQTVLKQRCSDALKTLAIEGENMQPSAISDPFFSYISSTFSNLTYLHLKAFNLAFVNLASFPASLKRLELTFCMFPDDFFDVLKTENVFPKLEYLDLSMNVGMTDDHLERISYVKSLKALLLKQNRNQDITDLGAKYISRLKNIDVLNVANTGITDTGVDHLASSLPKLRILDLSMLRLTNLTITALGNYSKNLEILVLNQCFGVSDIMPLVNLPYLRKINTNNTSLEKETVTEFSAQNPNVTIEFKFQSYLKSRAGSSITVSDGRFCI